MISSVEEILGKLNSKLEPSDHEMLKFFQENGYCIMSPSQLVLENIDQLRIITDALFAKESWRGGWEGKEQYIKYKKTFNKGGRRLANLFNKDKLFLDLLSEKNLLKILYGLFGNDMKIGALDLREPSLGTGWQELHIDWLPKKNSDDLTQNVICFIFLDDANKENGTMRVVPKTHKKVGWIDDHQKDKSSHQDEIYIDVKEGSIILMDANTWHSGSTNHDGARRRVLYMDVRRRSIPQLLNQRIYLDENTQNSLSAAQKFLLGVRENDEIYDERVFAVGDYYRKHFKTDVVVKEQ